MLHTLAIQNSRSLRNTLVPLGKLNIIKGGNALVKSNLYKALCLLPAPPISWSCLASPSPHPMGRGVFCVVHPADSSVTLRSIRLVQSPESKGN